MGGNLFEHLNSGIQNHLQALKDQDKKDAEAWREFVRLFEYGEFFGDSTNRHYNQGQDDMAARIEGYISTLSTN